MHILIAEDEVSTAKALKILMERAKFSTDVVNNGNDAWDYAQSGRYDVIVLDIMMPGKSGLEVLSLIRGRGMNTPVLLLTAKSQIEDRVSGLDAGADDYLPKPFATSELIARVKALARRSGTYSDSTLTFSDLVLDCNRYILSCGKSSASLTNKEFQLFELFMKNPGHVFSADHLMDTVWGFDSSSEIDVVWTHIGFIRKKLRSLDSSVEIKTVRGAGYAMEAKTC
ncbi:MAG: response regulator transcription factor [Sphaerochaetaceae bacterium]|nr:response regulator transcription factor [Sphaerochaetaceae bacterium]